MKELTDLEICKRIAEIKKIMPTVFGGTLITNIGEFDLFNLSRTHRANKHARYVLDLMFDFGVNVDRDCDCAFILSDYTDRPHKAQVSFTDGDELSFRRAILLTIIEANNE